MTTYARSDVYPPKVEAIGDMHPCTNEDHVFGCPCGVGGDPIEAACFFCSQLDTGVLVTIEGATRSVCDRCYNRTSPTIPLDYTEVVP